MITNYESPLEHSGMTREEFERWLALQLAMGWTVRNPESIDKIRAEFRKGATLAPFREIPQPKL